MICQGLLLIFFSIMMQEWLLLKYIPRESTNIKVREQKPYPIYDPSSLKTIYPLGPHIPIYNIASRAAQSNSVYVSVLQISIVHSDCASKSLFFAERPLLGWGKIFRYFATIMGRNRDSTHQSQNEDNFRPFLLG